jgi:hypothetical protein
LIFSFLDKKNLFPTSLLIVPGVHFSGRAQDFAKDIAHHRQEHMAEFLKTPNSTSGLRNPYVKYGELRFELAGKG